MSQVNPVHSFLQIWQKNCHHFAYFLGATGQSALVCSYIAHFLLQVSTIDIQVHLFQILWPMKNSTVSVSGIPSMCEPPLQPAASTVARQVPLSGSPSTWSRFTAAIRVLRRRSMESVRSHQRSFTSFLIPTVFSHTGICLRIYMIIESEENLSDVFSVLINKLLSSCHG